MTFCDCLCDFCDFLRLSEAAHLGPVEVTAEAAAWGRRLIGTRCAPRLEAGLAVIVETSGALPIAMEPYAPTIAEVKSTNSPFCMTLFILTAVTAKCILFTFCCLRLHDSSTWPPCFNCCLCFFQAMVGMEDIATSKNAFATELDLKKRPLLKLQSNLTLPLTNRQTPILEQETFWTST